MAILLNLVKYCFYNYHSEGYFCVIYVCPTEAVLKKKVGGTIKEPQWYGLGTLAPKSYHSVLFFN